MAITSTTPTPTPQTQPQRTHYSSFMEALLDPATPPPSSPLPIIPDLEIPEMQALALPPAGLDTESPRSETEVTVKNYSSPLPFPHKISINDVTDMKIKLEFTGDDEQDIDNFTTSDSDMASQKMEYNTNLKGGGGEGLSPSERRTIHRLKQGQSQNRGQSSTRFLDSINALLSNPDLEDKVKGKRKRLEEEDDDEDDEFSGLGLPSHLPKKFRVSPHSTRPTNTQPEISNTCPFPIIQHSCGCLRHDHPIPPVSTTSHHTSTSTTTRMNNGYGLKLNVENPVFGGGLFCDGVGNWVGGFDAEREERYIKIPERCPNCTRMRRRK